MSSVNLILGIMLTWTAGLAGMLCLDRSPRLTTHAGSLAGTGFFVGHALLSFLVLATSAVLGTVSFAVVALLLAAIAAGGIAIGVRLARKRIPSPAVAALPTWPGAAWSKALLLVLVGWSAAHLTFAGVEIITTPVFPWDAWTVWVYRAKAWFLAGHLFDFLTFSDWLRAKADLAYTIPAIDYPLLPSIVPYWAAVSLGRWHEALVNVPAWFCGVAIVVGFYGQCRQQGLGLPVSIAFTYLLVSTPLFGTHMSLGGYADIWLAGFSGLGFVALLRGLSERRRGQTLLGLGLLTLGLLIKLEGAIWLASALLLLAVMTIPVRVQLYAAGVLIVVLGGLVASGMTFFELPVIGAVGLDNGRLHVPLAGSYAIELHDVRRAYFRNAFALGSWNLAWVMVGVGFVAAALRPTDRRRRAALSFMLIFVATQILIFVFTSQGAWAEDETAINRLPLQIYPALLFAVAMTYQSFQPASETGGVPLRALGALALALGLTATAALIWLARIHQEPPVVELALGWADFQPVVGGGRPVEDALVIDGYADGFVLLSSGPVRIDANDHQLLRIALEFDQGLQWPDEAPAFFWRSSIRPEEVSRVTLDGAPLVDLSTSEDWREEITEVGLLFPEHAGQPAVLEGLWLEGRNLSTTLELIPRQWFEFEPWSQKSAHALHGGARDQEVPLPLLMAISVVLALLMLAALSRGRHRRGASIALIFLAGWVVLDIRWTADRVRQMDRSMRALASQSIDQRVDDSELGKFYPYVRRIRDEVIGAQPARILLLRDPAEHEFFGLRSKYQFLPHAVALAPRLPGRRPPENLDYVLFLGAFASEAAARYSTSDRLRQLSLAPGWARRLILMDESPEGLLFSVAPRPMGSGER